MKLWSKINLENTLVTLALSVLLNVILVLLTSLLFNLDPTKKPTVNEKQYLTVKSYRTVGEKSGRKNSFSAPSKQTEPSSASKSQATPSININELGSLNETSLVKNEKKSKKIEPIKFSKEKPSYSFSSKPPLKQRMRKQQQQLQGDVLKNLAMNPSFANALSNKGFNVQFDAPEGIKEDELNSIEKIFYSFQKRTYEKYLNSFLKTYYTQLTSNPNLKEDIMSSRHRLNARVQFDSNGFILSVKILKSSDSDSIHKLFETTLDQMRSIPNPPKDLLGKDGNFTIYYSLYIN